MTEIALRFHHRNKKDCAGYKPVDDDRDRGPSVLVNRTFVSEYCRGMDPAKANPTLIVQGVSTPSTSTDARPPNVTGIALRFHHADDGKFAYFKPVDAARAPGPSVFVDQTLVSEYFRGLETERATVTLIVRSARTGRVGVGE